MDGGTLRGRTARLDASIFDANEGSPNMVRMAQGAADGLLDGALAHIAP